MKIKMNNKNLIYVISIIVIVFLAAGFILLRQQKLMETQERSGRLILNDPEIEINDRGTISNPQYSNGSMPMDCCGAGDWQRVRLDAVSAGGQNRVCLFAHPRTDGYVALTYKNIKLKNNISFTTAIADGGVTGSNAPVNMDVYIDNSLLETITREDQKGWFTNAVDTSNYQNKSADVKLVISSENVSARWFCFDAQVVE